MTPSRCWLYQEPPASYWDRLNTRLERVIRQGGVRAMEAALEYFRVSSADAPPRVMNKVHMQVQALPTCHFAKG